LSISYSDCDQLERPMGDIGLGRRNTQGLELIGTKADVAAVTDDGRWAILAHDSGSVEVVDLEAGKSSCVFDPFAGGKTSVRCSPSAVTRDGKLIVTCLDDDFETLANLVVTDVATGGRRRVASLEKSADSRISITRDAEYALNGTQLFDL
jgi:hypothetical protein